MIVNCAAPHTPGGGGRWFKTLWGSGGADKNQHRIEEADERFKEIQNAYDTLSQPQERAWCVRRGNSFRWGALPLRPVPQWSGAAARRPLRFGRCQRACACALVRGSIRRNYETMLVTATLRWLCAPWPTGMIATRTRF